MSVETYYKQGPIREIGNGAISLKTLISDLLSLDTMLSLDSVITDTASEYRCRLKISDSRMGFIFYNRDSTYYIIKCYLNSSNEWVNLGSSSIDFQTGPNCVVVWGIGDCIRHFSIETNYDTGRFIFGTYSFLNSETYKEKIVLIDGGTGNLFTFPNAPIIKTFPSVFYNYEINSNEVLTTYSFVPDNSSVRSGFVYTLQPYTYKGYSSSKGFLNITFGEGHKLYKLYNGTNEVIVNPGEMVTIDGKQVMSVGEIFYAE